LTTLFVDSLLFPWGTCGLRNNCSSSGSGFMNSDSLLSRLGRLLSSRFLGTLCWILLSSAKHLPLIWEHFVFLSPSTSAFCSVAAASSTYLTLPMIKVAFSANSWRFGRTCCSISNSILFDLNPSKVIASEICFFELFPSSLTITSLFKYLTFGANNLMFGRTRWRNSNSILFDVKPFRPIMNVAFFKTLGDGML